MIEHIKKLFESYLEKNKTDNKIITSDIYRLYKYHRIDMLIVDNLEFLLSLNNDDKSELLQKKDFVLSKNKRYLDEIKQISIAFKKEAIDYVLLKGSALAYNAYLAIYHRYFADVDILVDYENIERVEKILHQQGYIHGDVVDGEIIRASRKTILYQQLHTHEIYKMVKLDHDKSEIKIDVNFMFTWNGFEKSNNKYSLKNIGSNIFHMDANGLDLTILDNEFQFVHLCSHFYNEAMYFSLDQQYVSGDDPKELLLFRLLDILIVAMKGINVKKIYNIADTINGINKIEYALSLIRVIMGIDYTDVFSKYFNINMEFPNHFYSKNGDKIDWPVSIYKRLFDIESKKQALNQLSEAGYL